LNPPLVFLLPQIIVGIRGQILSEYSKKLSAYMRA